MFPFFLTILLLLITTLTPLHSSTTPNPESLALLSFKQSITSDPDNTLSNWNPNTSTSSNPCTWNGITCKDGRVISLSIPKKKLTGYLPSSLGSLSNLRHINLRNNRFHGPLPPSLFHLTGLQSLVLYANSLSGSIPSDISNLIYLQNLDLSQNLLSNSIPSTILNCTRLRTLNLNTNNFTGSLPLGFGSRLTSLERLDLAHNSFTGTIPSDMGNLTNLQGTVDFSRNHFTGAIPPSLGELPEKVYIDLSYNDLTGPIPQHGALINRGPTAFIGNPGLCGPPLKNSCSADDDDDGNGSAASSPSSSSYPSLPSDGRANNDGKGKSGELSKTSIIAIVASDVVGICLIGLLCSYCYTRVCRNGGGSRTHDPGYGLETAGVTPGGKTGGGKLDQCFCFRRDESETPSENVEQYDLVKLDGQVGFDLDELLKASAFVLGKSGIGIVYKVVLEDGLTLAVRRLGEGGSQRFKEFQTEVEAIGKLKHPNIVQLRAYYWSVDEKLLIYEFVPNGNLAAALHGKPGMTTFIPLPWSTRLLIMRGIAKGLVYLHEFSPKKYVHGDLNPSNILLGRNMEPKIADFGLARLANIAGNSPPTLQTSNRMMLAASTSEKPPPPHQRQHSNVPSETATSISTTTNVLAYYQAPESLKSIKPSQKWDVYSYGVILMEIITGRSPLVQVGGGSEMDLVQWIQMCIDEKKPLVDVLDPALAAAEEVGDDDYKEDEIVGALKIAMACVSSSPERRPSMRHVCDALDQLCE